jgi:hypothetical protein
MNNLKDYFKPTIKSVMEKDNRFKWDDENKYAIDKILKNYSDRNNNEKKLTNEEQTIIKNFIGYKVYMARWNKYRLLDNNLYYIIQEFISYPENIAINEKMNETLWQTIWLARITIENNLGVTKNISMKDRKTQYPMRFDKEKRYAYLFSDLFE